MISIDRNPAWQKTRSFSGPREKDTASGVTRKTLRRLASALNVAESEVIHRALAKYAQENLPPL